MIMDGPITSSAAARLTAAYSCLTAAYSCLTAAYSCLTAAYSCLRVIRFGSSPCVDCQHVDRQLLFFRMP